MTADIIEQIEKQQMKKQVPSVHVGDSVSVSKMIVEGKRKRIQKFDGTVVKIQGTRSRKSFTVRKVVNSVGVEKSYLLHSPLVAGIEVLKRGKVRRAKLNYLRERVGAKATRVKTKE